MQFIPFSGTVECARDTEMLWDVSCKRSFLHPCAVGEASASSGLLHSLDMRGTSVTVMLPHMGWSTPLPPDEEDEELIPALRQLKSGANGTSWGLDICPNGLGLTVPCHTGCRLKSSTSK